MPKKIKTGRHVRRGGMVVLAITDLQEAYDTMRNGGAIVMDLRDPYPVQEILLVSNDRFNEIVSSMGAEEPTRH